MGLPKDRTRRTSLLKCRLYWVLCVDQPTRAEVTGSPEIPVEVLDIDPSSGAGGVDEFPVADINPHMKRLLGIDLEINQIGRGKLRDRNRFSGEDHSVRFAGEGKMSGLLKDVADEAAAIKPLRRRPAEAVWGSQQGLCGPDHIFLSGCDRMFVISWKL